jgi:hypothetical protein
VSYLEDIIPTKDEEIRRRDVIISQLSQRIPKLEARAAQELSEKRQSVAIEAT